MRRPALAIVFFLTSAWITPSFGAIETYLFQNEVQEKRYQRMIAELRCLVCQNQNLADSNADLARDLRAKTHAMIVAGASDPEIISYMVERYGDFVLYRPPFKSKTWLLWVGPFLILLVALVIFGMTIRKSRRPPPLTEAERRHASGLLDQEG